MTLAEPIYVKPGEVFCSRVPRVFKTVLGSCVSVCLWDPVRRVGGLNHIILPRRRGDEDDERFADVAIPRLIRKLGSLGGADPVAKVFGGAAVLPTGMARTVGEENTEVALAVLGQYGIPVVARRTGGVQGIVICFSSASGEVLVREIADSG